MIQIKIYTKSDCELCDPFIKTFETICNKWRWRKKCLIEIIDITSDETLYNEYKERIPLATLNDRMAFKFFVKPTDLQKKLKQVLIQMKNLA